MAMVVVTLIATEGKALAGNFFAGEAVMTLMTLNCGLILDARFVCQPRWLSSITY
jgi:hypothetical protein